MVVACAAPAAPDWDSAIFNETEISIGSDSLTVAVADTAQKRARGLTDVEELPDLLDGMLFVYDSPTSASFHMLNTPMPLDIWWFDSDDILVGTTEMEPCFIEPCVSYASPGRVLWVLETPLGDYELSLGEMISTG